MATHQIIYQSWTESERGWGQKHWSYSLHLTIADMEQFNAAYWKTQPGGPAPDWYIRPDSNPQTVLVDEELYEKLTEQKQSLSGNDFGGKGIWYHQEIVKVLASTSPRG